MMGAERRLARPVIMPVVTVAVTGRGMTVIGVATPAAGAGTPPPRPRGCAPPACTCGASGWACVRPRRRWRTRPARCRRPCGPRATARTATPASMPTLQAASASQLLILLLLLLLLLLTAAATSTACLTQRRGGAARGWPPCRAWRAGCGAGGVSATPLVPACTTRGAGEEGRRVAQPWGEGATRTAFVAHQLLTATRTVSPPPLMAARAVSAPNPPLLAALTVSM